MDTVTQIVLGTAIAEGWFRRELGRKSLLFGAFCGWFPDSDVLLHRFGTWESMVSHRAETHSLLCLPLFALPLAWVGHRWGKKGRWGQWYHLAFWAVVTHPLLDSFTSYGTQLFAPLSNVRIAWDGVGIIDLIYTLPLIYVCWHAFRQKSDRAQSQKHARWALGLTTLYLLFGFALSQRAIQHSTARFKAEGFEPVAVKANPALLFSFLRRVTARDARGHLITTSYSPFMRDAVIVRHTPPEVPELNAILESEEGQIFSWFNEGFYSVHIEDQTLTLVDARYGFQSDPWNSPFSATVDLNAWPEAKLQLQQRPKLDIGAEFSLGWKRMWGLSN